MIANSSIVDVRIDKPSATIILNRPARKNAISSESVQRILEAFADLNQERGVSAVILTGSSDSFCSGTDLNDLNLNLDDEASQEKWFQETMAMNELLETMLRFPKPIIAAVNGAALGYGFALSLACDLIIASPEAFFGCPEIKRGLVPGLVSPLLAFRVGAAKAASYALTGSQISCEEAKSAGFLHEVVQNDNVLWARANDLAKVFAENSPQSMQMTKNLINETVGEAFLTHLNLGTANSAAARTTESAKEGVRAFVDKRSPKWS